MPFGNLHQISPTLLISDVHSQMSHGLYYQCQHLFSWTVGSMLEICSLATFFFKGILALCYWKCGPVTSIIVSSGSWFEMHTLDPALHPGLQTVNLHVSSIWRGFTCTFKFENISDPHNSKLTLNGFTVTPIASVTLSVVCEWDIIRTLLAIHIFISWNVWTAPVWPKGNRTYWSNALLKVIWWPRGRMESVIHSLVVSRLQWGWNSMAVIHEHTELRVAFWSC